MRAVIFANGILQDASTARLLIQPEDLIIAADGGARHCLELGITPHLVIGDFDSLTGTEIEQFASAGVELIRYPTRKDFTDLELALQQAVARGADQILIIAALGDRWDQTFANLLLPTADFLRDTQVRMVDGSQEVFLIQSGEQVDIQANPGDTLSLIPLTLEAKGITTRNLEYPLQAESLFLGSTRGISNVFLEENASVSLQEGMLLCVVIHKTIGDFR